MPLAYRAYAFLAGCKDAWRVIICRLKNATIKIAVMIKMIVGAGALSIKKLA